MIKMMCCAILLRGQADGAGDRREDDSAGHAVLDIMLYNLTLYYISYYLTLYYIFIPISCWIFPPHPRSHATRGMRVTGCWSRDAGHVMRVT